MQKMKNKEEILKGCGNKFRLNLFQDWICGEEHRFSFKPKCYLCPECKKAIENLKNDRT